jgi:hypothetical protein
MRTFYTYIWLRENGTPYYIGKGTGRRAFTGRRNDGHLPHPPRNCVLIQEFPSEADAFAAETFIIGYYGRKDNGTGILRNLTDGGDGIAGYRHTPASRQSMSAKRKGKKRPLHSVVMQRLWQSSEHRNTVSAAQTGKPKPLSPSGKLAMAAHNRTSENAAALAFGLHNRWHVNRGISSKECALCQA